MNRMIASLALLSAIAPLSASAESRSAAIQVSVTVVARAIATVDEQPQEVAVTSEDLRRGYVELAASLRINVRTNARNGYILRLVNTDPAFASAELTSGDLAVNVRQESVITRPRPVTAGRDALALKVRLILGAQAREGRYPFPVVVDATPRS
jgi:type II secretory pathway component PulC